jgi:hypothetical protein
MSEELNSQSPIHCQGSQIRIRVDRDVDLQGVMVHAPDARSGAGPLLTPIIHAFSEVKDLLRTRCSRGLERRHRPLHGRTYHDGVSAVSSNFYRPVLAKFEQRQGSSAGEAILIKAIDRPLGLSMALARGCHVGC